MILQVQIWLCFCSSFRLHMVKTGVACLKRHSKEIKEKEVENTWNGKSVNGKLKITF